jgi:ubiquinone/menaquinone biosynthesis C-methylase UbiE
VRSETNLYRQQLTSAQIELRQHKLLDIGCGALRGGIHFINYVDAGNHYGLDLNSWLIEAFSSSERNSIIC